MEAVDVLGGVAEDAAGEDEHKHVFGSTTD